MATNLKYFYVTFFFQEAEWVSRFQHRFHSSQKKQGSQEEGEDLNSDDEPASEPEDTDLTDSQQCNSLFSLLGISSLMETTVTQPDDQEIEKKSPPTEIENKIHDEETTGQLKRKLSDLFLSSPKSAEKKRPRSICREASSTKSSVSGDSLFSPSVEGFGATPKRLVKRYDEEKSLLSTMEEFGIYDGNKSANDMGNWLSNVSKRTSLFNAASSRGAKNSPSKKKQKSVIGF